MGETRGRPRKYPVGYKPPRGKNITGLSKQQAAELSHGSPIVQLDYETGEFIADYPSMTALADDYDVPLGSIMSAFNKDCCCFVKLPKYQLLLIRKKNYELIKGEVI